MSKNKHFLAGLLSIVLAIPAALAGVTSASAVFNMNLLAVSQATNSHLSWVNPSVGFTDVTLDYKIHSASTWTVASANITTNSYVVTGLTPSTAYDFRVTANTGDFMTVTDTTLAANPCAVGTYSTTGYDDATCMPAGLGKFVGAMASTSATPCPPGYYADVTGLAACNPARAGKFVSVFNAIIDVPCEIGSFASSTASTACTPARIGYYVASTGSIADTPCPAGTSTLTSGSSACVPVSTPTPRVTQIRLDSAKTSEPFTASLNGENLLAATSIYVGSTQATVISGTDEKIGLKVPGLKPGTYDLVLKFAGSGSFTWQSAIVIPEAAAPTTGAQSVPETFKPFTLTIDGFRTTDADLNTDQAKQLSAVLTKVNTPCRVDATVFAYAKKGIASRASAAQLADRLNQILRAKLPGAVVTVKSAVSAVLADARKVSISFTPAK